MDMWDIHFWFVPAKYSAGKSRTKGKEAEPMQVAGSNHFHQQEGAIFCNQKLRINLQLYRTCQINGSWGFVGINFLPLILVGINHWWGTTKVTRVTFITVA